MGEGGERGAGAGGGDAVVHVTYRGFKTWRHRSDLTLSVTDLGLFGVLSTKGIHRLSNRHGGNRRRETLAKNKPF